MALTSAVENKEAAALQPAGRQAGRQAERGEGGSIDSIALSIGRRK